MEAGKVRLKIKVIKIKILGLTVPCGPLICINGQNVQGATNCFFRRGTELDFDLLTTATSSLGWVSPMFPLYIISKWEVIAPSQNC